MYVPTFVGATVNLSVLSVFVASSYSAYSIFSTVYFPSSTNVLFNFTSLTSFSVTITSFPYSTSELGTVIIAVTSSSSVSGFSTIVYASDIISFSPL